MSPGSPLHHSTRLVAPVIFLQLLLKKRHLFFSGQLVNRVLPASGGTPCPGTRRRLDGRAAFRTGFLIVRRNIHGCCSKACSRIPGSKAPSKRHSQWQTRRPFTVRGKIRSRVHGLTNATNGSPVRASLPVDRV